MIITKKLTKNLAKEIIFGFAQEYSVRVYYSVNLDYHGHCRYWNRTITLGFNQTPEQMITTFFHELGHIHCYTNGIWKNFHSSKLPSDMSDVEKKRMIATAVKAEKWVDKWAKNEMKKNISNLPYDEVYSSKENQKDLVNYLKKYLDYGS